MKKLLFAVVLAVCLAIPALAQDSKTASTPIWDRGDNVSELTYQNVTVYKVYDQKDVYVVLYAKQGTEIGQVSIPKRWAADGQKVARKLVMRNKSKGLPSYMTVFYKNDEFYKVMLTVSPNRDDPVWAVAPYGMQVDSSVETLTVKY